MSRYEVYVGNVGCVHSSNSLREARLCFNTYCDRSKANYGRVGGEEITLFENGDIIESFPEVDDGYDIGD